MFQSDPVMIGRRIQNQQRIIVPTPAPSYPMPTASRPVASRPMPVAARPQPPVQPQPEPRVTFHPVLVPGPDELGIHLSPPGQEALEIPPPEQLGIVIEALSR